MKKGLVICVYKVHIINGPAHCFYFQVKGQARQRVRLAVQLLSNSVATAAERFLDRREEGSYVRTLDRGFDALNAQSPADAKELRRGMRPDSSVHQSALTDLEAAARLPFEGKVALLPCQKGLLVTIASMRGLVAQVTTRLGPSSYVLTGRINQDPLESFFGLVQGRGGACLHPSPSEARVRLRHLTLMMTLRLGVSPLSGVPPVAAAASADDPESGTVERAVFEDFLEDCSGAGKDIAGELQEVETLLATVSQAPAARPQATASPVDPLTGVTAEEYALAHAAGYVSAKCRRVDPTLGTPSALVDDAAPAQALWTRLISQGGLSVPSEEWLGRFRAMESKFCTAHHFGPDGLSRAPKVVESLVKTLVAEPGSLDVRVVRRFVRLRTFIRMSQINKRRRVEALEQRENRQRRQFSH